MYLLIGDDLGLPEPPQERLVCSAEGRCVTRFALAAAERRVILERAVPPGAPASAIEPLGAVGACWAPFADDGPKVERGQLRAQLADGGDVLRLRFPEFLEVESSTMAGKTMGWITRRTPSEKTW